jgi:valyl-tRNA synthetase
VLYFILCLAECGADALRFGLLSYTAQGRDINLDIQRVVAYRQFGNKLWQATRFALLNFDSSFVRPKNYSELQQIVQKGNNFCDQWILSRLANCVSVVTKSIEGYHFSDAALALHSFWLYEICDVYLETIKPLMRAEDLATNAAAQASKASALAVLYTCLDHGLRLLHPFMPFITEELYHRLPGFGAENSLHKAGTGGKANCGSIMVANYPTIQATSIFANPTVESTMALYSEIGKAARSTRASLGLTKKRVDLYIHTRNTKLREQLTLHSKDIGTIAIANKVVAFEAKEETPQGAINTVINAEIELFIPLKGLVDFGGELVKLEKNIESLEISIERSKAKIAGPGFDKSSEDVRNKIRAQLQSEEEEIVKLRANYENFQSLMSAEEFSKYLEDKINLLGADIGRIQVNVDKLRAGLPAEVEKQPKKVLTKIAEAEAEQSKIQEKIANVQQQQAGRK